jgi:hypothetical protein
VALRPEEPLVAVDEFLLRHAPILERVRTLISETSAEPTASTLAVVTQTLSRMQPRAPLDRA